MYKILPYSYNQAKKLNVIIKPSMKKDKKIDVYDLNNNYLLSIGSINHYDYPYYIEIKGKSHADKRRSLYKKRFEKTRHIKNTPSYYADKILW